MGTKQNKYDAIKQHLLNGNSITSLEAFTLFHITRLSAVIFRMKNRDGIDIESCTERHCDVSYSRYWISKEWLAREKEVDNAAAQEQANAA